VVAAKGEVVEKGHTVEQAKYGRDALAKVRHCVSLSVCLSAQALDRFSLGSFVKRKVSHIRFLALGLELIPVYRQSTRR